MSLIVKFEIAKCYFRMKSPNFIFTKLTHNTMIHSTEFNVTTVSELDLVETNLI